MRGHFQCFNQGKFSNVLGMSRYHTHFFKDHMDNCTNRYSISTGNSIMT